MNRDACLHTYRSKFRCFGFEDGISVAKPDAFFCLNCGLRFSGPNGEPIPNDPPVVLSVEDRLAHARAH